jgi:hypothetical protein
MSTRLRSPTTEHALLAIVAMLYAMVLSVAVAGAGGMASWHPGVVTRALFAVLAALACITAEAVWQGRPWAPRAARLLGRWTIRGCALWGPVSSLLLYSPDPPGWFDSFIASTLMSFAAAGVLSWFVRPMVRYVERTMPGAQP